MIQTIQQTIIDTLEDRKAKEIIVFQPAKNTLCERIIIASVNSGRQAKAVASHVRDAAKEKGATVIGVEGEDNGEWVLIDLDDIIVHIMVHEIRSYYRLEELSGTELYRSNFPAVTQ